MLVVRQMDRLQEAWDRKVRKFLLLFTFRQGRVNENDFFLRAGDPGDHSDRRSHWKGELLGRISRAASLRLQRQAKSLGVCQVETANLPLWAIKKAHLSTIFRLGPIKKVHLWWRWSLFPIKIPHLSRYQKHVTGDPDVLRVRIGVAIIAKIAELHENGQVPVGFGTKSTAGLSKKLTVRLIPPTTLSKRLTFRIVGWG